MSHTLVQIFQFFLKTGPVARLRRNHGLEHATLHVLSGKYPHLSMAGHSDLGGFWILGELETQAVQAGVQEALQRLRNGEHHLAVHPNCGTNFVTSGTLAGLAAAGAMFGARRRWQDQLERLPVAVAMATLALMVSQPVGLWLQERVTTVGDPQNLQVVEVRAALHGGIRAHRVLTRG